MATLLMTSTVSAHYGGVLGHVRRSEDKHAERRRQLNFDSILSQVEDLVGGEAAQSADGAAGNGMLGTTSTMLEFRATDTQY